jgi:hypothetical protein
MCLDIITQTFDPPVVIEQWAWKVFCVNKTVKPPRPLCGLYYKFNGDYWNSHQVGWPRGEWLQAVQVPALAAPVYMTGFHCYRTRSSARIVQRLGRHRRKVVKVKIRGVRLNGVQDGFQVLVADELFIPE